MDCYDLGEAIGCPSFYKYEQDTGECPDENNCWKEKKEKNKNNEILPFATAVLDLEGIMLNEVSQTKTNAI